MAISAVTIVNQALNHLGQQTITSLDDDSKAARAASQTYETTRDAVLELHPWSFATHRQALAASAERNLTDYAYMYILPSDPWCLKPRYFVGYKTTPWKQEGRYLYTNLSSATLCYTMRVEDPRWFSSNFIKALALQLAIDMAYAIAGKERPDLIPLFETQIIRAMGSDIEAGESLDAGAQTWNLGRYNA